ncbi:MAG TPA: hypothetical protein VFP84_28945 [Kofleriaceae bacterium]|nr:hypothetical protein [Kofleriaceae bacterium]
MTRSSLLALVLASVASFAAACISVPDGPKKMCDATSDCDHAHGEVCESGVCYGNPPPGPFAAVISPPSTRHDLVPRELASVNIPSNGDLGDLALAAPVLFNGKVVQFCPAPMTDCDTTASLAATIRVARGSQFHGGPGFQTVVNAVAGGSFSIPLPRTEPGDDPFTVTVVPDGGHPAPGVRSAAQQVPPRRLALPLTDNSTNNRIELGGAALPVVSGSLSDALGQGLAGYRVVAIGHWDPTEPTVEVSSVAFTDASGAYAITLSDGLAGTVELVAQPLDGTVGATIHLTNIDATRSTTHAITASAGLGPDFPVSVTVTGVDLSGIVSPIAGATVAITGALNQGSTTFAVNQQIVTGQDGIAAFHVLGGAGIAPSYRVSVTPPAGSPLAAVFAQKLTLPPAPGLALPIRLASRVAVQGAIADAHGALLSNVAVTARPSLRFLWTLDADPQAFVASIPPPTTVTQDGQFVLWVDANIAQVWGEYDLVIEPPITDDAPAFVQPTELARDGTVTTMQLGTIGLPDAAFVHGKITDADGAPVDSAEIKLYQVSTQLALCSEVAHAPTSCPIPATLLGRNPAADGGEVQLALPR